MNYDTITCRTEGRLAYITLNKPSRRNALDDVMINELTEAFASFNRNGETRAVVLTGEGKAFCAGMDLDYLRKCAAMGEHENLEDARRLLQLLTTIHSLKKPVIAMVNGPALGGGCGLAAACDFVFVSSEFGTMGAPEVKLGFLPAVIMFFLVKRMGEGRARELALQGEVLSPGEAVRRGLATDAVPHADLARTVGEFAHKLSRSTSPSSISLTKDLLARFSEMSVPDALDYAVNLNALTRKTEDFKKGIESFINKTPPEW